MKYAGLLLSLRWLISNFTNLTKDNSKLNRHILNTYIKINANQKSKIPAFLSSGWTPKCGLCRIH